MTLLNPIIYSTALVVCAWFGCEAYKDERAAHEKAETVRAQYAAVSKMLDAEIAYTQLEMKRTTVQREVREMVIAEMRRCKKGSCK